MILSTIALAIRKFVCYESMGVLECEGERDTEVGIHLGRLNYERRRCALRRMVGRLVVSRY